MTFNPLSSNFKKWSNTLKQFVGYLPTNCLSVFGHFVGLALKVLTSTAGYTQLIDKLTRFVSGEFSSIDLISCNKPEIVSEYGNDHSFFEARHHNLISAKISANMFLSPNYSRNVWDCKNTDLE